MFDPPLLAPQVVDMLVLKRVRGLLIKPFLNLFTEHVDIGLVDLLALVDQFNCVVNPDVF